MLASFYPRLREGGDVHPHSPAGSLSKFLPTPPRGRRLGCQRDVLKRTAVSTHASAREATRCETCRMIRPHGFYPRLREGGDVREPTVW